MAARIWGALPNERLKTAIIARLGQRFLVSVWAIIFDELGRVLLFCHSHDRRHPWGLPSGRLEGRETPEEAICREFSEEVGGRLRPVRLLLAFREPELPALRLVYQCVLEFPPMLPSVEVTAWGFLALEDLPLSLRPLQQMAIATARSQASRAVPRL